MGKKAAQEKLGGKESLGTGRQAGRHGTGKGKEPPSQGKNRTRSKATQSNWGRQWVRAGKK